ncbi:MAG: thioredoxin family protein [Bryobacterales bacterium]|nr:thioredoxin family protein [Bryobacterales bacterium]
MLIVAVSLILACSAATWASSKPTILPVEYSGVQFVSRQGREDQLACGRLPRRVAKARAEGKPLLVSFHRYSCTNCKWMKTNIHLRA